MGPARMTPRVSVVVPVRNRRALLRDLLDALAGQTESDHEVIVVDDGSSDGSGEEAELDIRQGRPVIVVRTDGVGAVAARCAGVKAARADLLAFTDSDCRPHRDWLAAGVAALDRGADVVQGRTVPTRPVRPLERAVQVPAEDGIYATCNVFYRRAAYDRAGGFDQHAGDRLGFRPGRQLRGLGFGEDTLLGWRVRRNGTAAFAADAIVEHAVFEMNLRDSARRAWTAGAFPALVREVPELRSTLLRHGVVLGSGSRVALHAAVAALALRRPGATIVAGAAWAGARVARVVRAEPSWRRRVVVAPADLALDVVAAVALVAGSFRARTVVL
jgi:hypothetical protein